MSKQKTTRIPVTNTHPSNNLHVGGAVIRPGETRHIEAHLVPSEHPKGAKGGAAVPESTTVDPMTTLVSEPIATITATLATLSDEQLVTLDGLESDGKDRLGVHEAIKAEQLRRASKED